MEEKLKETEEKREVKIPYKSFMKIVIAVEICAIVGLLIYMAVR